MARSLSFAALAVAVPLLLVGCALATPTTPFVSDAYALPVQYVVQRGGRPAVVSALQPADVALARGQYNRSNADIGWDYLKVGFDASVGEQGYYYAGYLEGYLTSAVIQLQGGLSDIPAGPVGDWIRAHVAYMKSQAANLGPSDKFWHKVGHLLALMDGIASGASAATGANVTFDQIFMVNFQAEYGDVVTAIQQQSGQSKQAFRAKARNTHCSAMIRVTESDLYMAHDTWDVFTGMAYRVHKVYSFGTDPTVVFAAHPAFVSSIDDWYQTSNQLAIQETTNMVMNLTLYLQVLPRSASEFVRAMTATLLANSGEEWTLYFSRENSGTYNNQYMVVDFKLYAPGSSVVANTLWIAEQLPGMVARGDVSDVLAAQGYWASYNIPYFREIYVISGYEIDLNLYGAFYSYTKYARPEIFKRNSSMIHSRPDMMRMMRFNHWQTDPLSTITNCTGAPKDECLTPRTAMMSIASRGDLVPVYNTTAEMVAHYGPVWAFMSQGCFGAIDSKIASWSNRHTLTAHVISGPTNDDQPTFVWNTLACAGSVAPPMTPTVVDFPWVEFRIVPPS